MSNDGIVDYKIYICTIHNKRIHYFKEHDHITGLYHCWDCIYDLNNKKEKSNEPRKQEDSGDREP